MKKVKTKLIKLIAIVYAIFGVGILHAQCIENKAFGAGEKLKFTGYYNWGFIWVNAGSVKVDISDTKYNGKEAYQIKGTAQNAKAFEIFFKLRDSLTTVVDKKTLRPYKLDRFTNEGNYHARHQYVYHYQKKQIQAFIKKNKHPQKNFTIPLDSCVNNILSVLYYARNIDYENLKKGAKIPIKILVDGKISKVEIRYKGTGKIKTRRGNKFNCYKITPVLPDGSMFKGGDDMVVWLTKDANRVPVMVEAKIKVGSVKGVLESYSGLRHKDNIFGKTTGTFERSKK